MKLLSINADTKTTKGTSKGYLTGIVYLAPHTLAGIKDDAGNNVNLCPGSNAECRKSCLFSAGRGVFQNVIDARIARTKLLFQNEAAFFAQLFDEIAFLQRKAAKLGLIPCVRLNGTSDLNWAKYLIEGKTVFEHFPTLQFYDYTKVFDNLRLSKVYSNYHVTFSYSGTNGALAGMALEGGHNVAVVVTEQNKDVLEGINGDETDLRFLDKPNSLVLLTAKGKAKKEQGKFIYC